MRYENSAGEKRVEPPGELADMPSLEGEGSHHVAEPPLFRDAQIELGVLTDAEGLVEEPDILENGAADDNR